MRSVGAIVVALFVAACTTIGPVASPTAPTAPPTPPPSAAATTQPPSVTPSPPPSASPTSQPTSTPTAAATAPPSATPPDATSPPAGSAYEQLLAHIPPAYRADCHEVTSFDAGFVMGIQCINIPSIDGYVTYYQFDGVANLNASYQSNVDFFGTEADGTSCEIEASEGGYTIGGTPAGRVMCADYDEGLIAYWTHEGFAIESSIVLFEGSYADLYEIWQIAGPDPAGPVSSPSPTSTAGAVSWSTSAVAHRGAAGQRFDYHCPPGGSPGSIWGTDVYTDDSSVCTAAVHTGLISLSSGGDVTIEISAGPVRVSRKRAQRHHQSRLGHVGLELHLRHSLILARRRSSPAGSAQSVFCGRTRR